MSNTIPNIMKTVTPSSNNNNNISSSIPKSLLPTSNDDSGADIIKITLIVGIILFLAYNLYLYLTEGTDVLGKYFGIGLTKTAETSRDIVDTSTEATQRGITGVKDTIDTGANTVADVGRRIEHRAESPLQRAINRSEDKPDNTEADISTESEIQQAKKSGYCYIGTDRTYRTCVEMSGGDKCVSGKVFPTKDICINPNLRK